MDETLRKITELLTRRRAELQEQFKSSDAWQQTTEELLGRVERLKSRLESGVTASSNDKKPR